MNSDGGNPRPKLPRGKEGATVFKFHDPGKLVDEELELVLVEKYPGDPTIGHVPAYKFRMTLVGQDEKIGRIELRVGNTNHIVMYGLLLRLARRHGLKTLDSSPTKAGSRNDRPIRLFRGLFRDLCYAYRIGLDCKKTI